ncbi:family 78 glycoside hydrolase catalytic domain [Subtercola vilae]|uniref:alpha-L-rhamnosidase n=1 Tax=Subtercola vilae TaxID=2056433 RepID=A0A4V4RF82_9MICO|nr:family 78 glycoside hydrolase catalytic domain [Subtercola vilae]TIH36624.1 LPXTG cell wall anchor domain-containing protein [Subtercola vilae]
MFLFSQYFRSLTHRRTGGEASAIRTVVKQWIAVAVAFVLLLGSLASGGLTAAASTETPSSVGTARAASALEINALTTGELRTNGLTDPLGTSTEAPTFSWKDSSTGRAVSQIAYEVRVASSESALPSADVWASGKVVAADQLNVTYAGAPLAAETRYFWQVRAWGSDQSASDWSAPAWFETALAGSDAWKGEWVGGPDPAVQLQQWSDYTVTVNFTMDNLVMGLYAREKDSNNSYMWQLSVADGTPRLRPHVKINGGFQLLENKDISAFISADQLRTGSHSFAVTFAGNVITSSLDGVVIDSRTDNSLSQGYVGFRQSVAQEGKENSTIHSVKVVSPTAGVLLDTDFSDGQNPFSGGTVTNDGLQLIAPVEPLYLTEQSKPLLRKSFTVDKTVTNARLYAAARGVYELSLNGQKVGDQQLAPGWTDYAKRIDYQTYDVTSLVASGSNAIGAELGDGWYAGNIASFGPGHWGTAPSLIAELRIDYSDGTSTWVNSDASWKTAAGPFVQADLIEGETFDARKVPTGWKDASYSDASWAPVGVADAAATALLEPQSDQPVRVTEKRTPISVSESAPNTWIYDMGQNMVGVAAVQLTGTANRTATIRYGEMLNPDKTLYTANLRSAKATDYYTFKTTGTADYTPTFTFHGFRYLEVTGVTTPPTVNQVTGLVWGTDLPTTGTLTTSDAMLNQLQSNITWGQRGNFLSIPTDTPARDERLGWTGDISVFSPTASYNQDTLAFLSKWLVDLSDSQGADGNLPGVSPAPPGSGCCGGGTGWSDAGVTVPFALYNAYGDTAVIRDNYAMMTKFMNYVETSTGSSLIRNSGGYADWLNLDDPTDSGLLGTAYYSYISGLMSQMAAAIGKTDDAAHYADLAARVKAAFGAKYLAGDGTVAGNSETGYAMAIGMNLVPADRLALVGDKYVAKLASRDNHLSTGFLGTPWLLPALTATGHQDLAYQLLNTKSYPSWGYEVASGATTMWERWDSLRPDGSFGDVSMNSFNHYAYGAVGDWMYANIGGIAATSAGYKTFTVAPTPGGGLTSGKGTFDSVYGSIVSDWKTTATGLDLGVTVPVSTTATVKIAATNHWEVTEGGKPLDQIAGVSVVSDTNGVTVLTVGSGTYNFNSDPANSGLSVSLVAPGEATALPGDTVHGSLHVVNTAANPATGFSAVLSLGAGLTANPPAVSATSVAPGASVDLPFSVALPASSAAGDVTVTAAVTATVGGEVRHFTLVSKLVSVVAAIAIAPITAVLSDPDSPETATITATLTNSAHVAISGTLVVDPPKGWPTALPSRLVTVAPGASTQASVVVSVPLSLNAGAQTLTARFVAGSATLASATSAVTVLLATPPAGALDHIDLGEATSEAAHNTTSTGDGGTTVEAGLTRRYSGLTKVGAAFSFDMQVTPNQPFLLRAIETYDMAQIKSYDILVNGQQVAQRLNPRTDSGPGLVTYQALIPDDGTLTSTGKVTITFRFNGLGDHDPSIADVWTLPVPKDTVAPSLVLDVSHAGANGWYTAGAAATLQADDARSGVATVEYQLDDGAWQPYAAPVALNEGSTLLRYRATDRAGNVSAALSEVVRVDATAPTVWGWLSTAGRVVAFTQDGGSGADHLQYSDGGVSWVDSLTALLGSTSSPSTLSVRAIDMAGNTSAALALTPRDAAPTLIIAPGQTAIAEASGFAAAATVRVELHSDIVVLGTATADAMGAVSVSGAVPADFAAGAHELVFVVETLAPDPGTGNGATPGTGPALGSGASGTAAGSSLTVPAQVLAATGATPLLWATSAGLLLLAGLVLLVVRRHRRRRGHDGRGHDDGADTVSPPLS